MNESLYFIIYHENNKWHWKCQVDDTKVLAIGPTGYKDKQDALDCINRLKQCIRARIFDDSQKKWID